MLPKISLQYIHKIEKHLRTCDKSNFTIFPRLQLSLNDTDLRLKYKANLNSLQKERIAKKSKNCENIL